MVNLSEDGSGGVGCGSSPPPWVPWSVGLLGVEGKDLTGGKVSKPVMSFSKSAPFTRALR